jgi:hypothetical protein
MCQKPVLYVVSQTTVLKTVFIINIGNFEEARNFINLFA